MTPAERIEQLETENAYLKDQLADLRGDAFQAGIRMVIGATGQQADLAAVLYRNVGKVVRKTALWDQVFAYRNGDGPEMRIVDVQVCKLRQKLKALGAPPGVIETIWGVGYTLTDKGAAWLTARIFRQPTSHVERKLYAGVQVRRSDHAEDQYT
jgi:DNA-binding response OmpR family regulator